MASTTVSFDYPCVDIQEAGYHARLAESERDLDAITRLRYEVFNLELGSGLESSHATGRDRDQFDEGCHHLLVTHMPSDRVVGTYRVQTVAQAFAHHGLYSASEFNAAALPADVLAEGAEVGRACVHRDFRKRRVLLMLWKGLAAYLESTGKRYLFGCCSLPTIAPEEAHAADALLRSLGAWHPTWHVPPAEGAVVPADVPPRAVAPELPSLFRAYLRFGATVCGGPVIDEAFGTTDFFVVLDRRRLPADALPLLFPGF